MHKLILIIRCVLFFNMVLVALLRKIDFARMNVRFGDY